jgi:ABC-type enterochelin transport system substrate-binding protein
MKKKLHLIILLAVCLTACTTQSNTNIADNAEFVAMSEAPMETTAKATAVTVEILEIGASIEIPASWENLYTIEVSDVAARDMVDANNQLMMKGGICTAAY